MEFLVELRHITIRVWTIFIIDIGYHTTSHGGKEDNFDNSSEGSCDVLDRYYIIPSL